MRLNIKQVKVMGLVAVLVGLACLSGFSNAAQARDWRGNGHGRSVMMNRGYYPPGMVHRRLAYQSRFHNPGFYQASRNHWVSHHPQRRGWFW